MKFAFPCMEIRNAVKEDARDILSLLRGARAFQIREGNPQWEEGYPSLSVIEGDILGGSAIVLLIESQLAGYAAIVHHDEGYENIPFVGRRENLEWCVIHRFALSDRFRGQGIGKAFLCSLTQLLLDMREKCIFLDTGENNISMQKVAKNAGYECLGITHFPWGMRMVYRFQSQKAYPVVPYGL